MLHYKANTGVGYKATTGAVHRRRRLKTICASSVPPTKSQYQTLARRLPSQGRWPAQYRHAGCRARIELALGRWQPALARLV
jgi:hypothetical protein